MDISPVYELRERLKAAAIAGVGAGAGDFRLKRAIGAMEPLEKVSPVFAGILRFARQAADENCEDRAGALLDALTLTDALLCTQGAVSAAGQIVPFPVEEDEAVGAGGLPEEHEAMEEDGSPEEGGFAENGTVMAEVPCSVLSQLLDALTHSGNGRYGYVVELHKEQPALFADYRVRAAMVDALGAPYAELAESVTEWLIEDGQRGGGAGILPLLQRGFDPKGKKEMVRRIWVMEAVAGARANAFYLRMLPEAEKEVRQALLYALRLSSENEELLLQLVKTERGNSRKMACLALACMEGKAWEYFGALAEKKPEEALEYLEFSMKPEASALVSEMFLHLMEKQKERGGRPEKGEQELFTACLRALPGKSGEGICACYRMAAASGNIWDGPEAKSRSAATFTPPDRNFPKEATTEQMLCALLQHGLVLHPAPELVELAGELYRTRGEAYFPAAMTACLMTGGDGECLELLRDFVEKKQLLGKKIRKERAPLVQQAFAALGMDPEGAARLTALSIHPGGRAPERFIRPAGPVPEGIYELLMALEYRGTDMILASWIRPEDGAMCERLAVYFHERALKVSDNRMYLEPLGRCGRADCTRLAVTYFRARGRAVSFEIISYLNQLPGSPDARRAEAESLLALLKKGEIKGVNNCIPVLETYIKEQFAKTQE